MILLRLGTYEYGLWVTLGQSIGFFMLLDLGIANSVCRYISGLDSPDSIGEKIGIYSTAVFVFMGSSCLIAILTLVIMPFVPTILNLKIQYHITAKILFSVLGLHTSVVLPLRVARGLIQAKNKYYLIDLISVISSFTRSILIFTSFFINKLDLYALCFLNVSCSIGSEIALYFMARKLHPGLKFKLSYVTAERFKRIFSFGASSLLQTLSGLIYSKGQTLIVGISLGMEAASIFHIPASLLMRIGPFIGRAGATFLPIVRNYVGNQKSENIILLSLYGLRYSLIIGWSIAFYCLIFGNQLITFWLNTSTLKENELKAIYSVLMIMIFPIVIARANKGNQTILRGIGKHWMVSNFQFISAVLGLGASAILIQWFDLYIYGAAIGWSLTVLLPQITIFQVAIIKTTQYRFIEYFLKTYVPSLISILPAVISVLTYQYFYQVETFISITIGTVIYCLIAAVGIFFWGLDKNHKMIIFQ